MRPKIKTGREKTASARMDQELTDRFKWALQSQHVSMARALTQMIMAYCKLAEKLNGIPISTLEFKGVELRALLSPPCVVYRHGGAIIGHQSAKLNQP